MLDIDDLFTSALLMVLGEQREAEISRTSVGPPSPMAAQSSINTLSHAIQSDSDEPLFDLDKSGLVTVKNQDCRITELRMTWIGDAILDGDFSTRWGRMDVLIKNAGALVQR